MGNFFIYFFNIFFYLFFFYLKISLFCLILLIFYFFIFNFFLVLEKIFSSLKIKNNQFFDFEKMSSEKKRNSLTFGKNNFVSSKLKNQNKENKKREKKYKTITFKSDKNITKINEMIKNKNLTSRVYSRSFAERYIPLSKTEKVNEIRNMNESSLNRFKTYSNIFEQIKKEINDINSNLNNSFMSNLSKRISNNISKDNSINFMPIEEQDDENCSPVQVKKRENQNKKETEPFFEILGNEKIITSTSSSNNINENCNISKINILDEKKDNIDDSINISSLNENVKTIILSPTEQSETMCSLKLKNQIIKNNCLHRKNSFKKYQLMKEKKFILLDKDKKEKNIIDKEKINYHNCNCCPQ